MEGLPTLDGLTTTALRGEEKDSEKSGPGIMNCCKEATEGVEGVEAGGIPSKIERTEFAEEGIEAHWS